MMKRDIFKTLFLLARPAAGKSEIIHFLHNLPENDRRERFHIGEMVTIDDFPMLWTWFEEDDILEKMGKERLHSDPDGYFKYAYLWDVLIQRIELEFHKLHRDKDLTGSTVIIEFSRGKEHGGYQSAFSNISEALAKTAAILYVDVPWEESLRKNRKRFNPDKPDSILEHGLSDEKMQRLYAETDWHELTASNPHAVTIDNCSVPYAVFDNHNDLTSKINAEFESVLENTIDLLWQRYEKNK